LTWLLLFLQTQKKIINFFFLLQTIAFFFVVCSFWVLNWINFFCVLVLSSDFFFCYLFWLYLDVCWILFEQVIVLEACMEDHSHLLNGWSWNIRLWSISTSLQMLLYLIICLCLSEKPLILLAYLASQLLSSDQMHVCAVSSLFPCLINTNKDKHYWIFF